MLTLLNLFGRSPFAPLQAHMDSVALCVHKLPVLFEAIEKGDYQLVETLATEISELEHNADVIKNDIRNHLKHVIFLPIDKNRLLDILTIQDDLADLAEDIAILATLKPMEILPLFRKEFWEFVQKNLIAFDEAHAIIRELHELVESSFGGSEAEKVRLMVDQVTQTEHEVDLIQRQLLKILFSAENQINYVAFYQWQRLFQDLSSISNLSENLANRVRMTLELK